MSPEVLIIGGGVSGLATALSLASAGRCVGLVERGPVARESSWAGAGILSLLLPWHYPAPVRALAEHGRDLWPAWVERLRALTGLAADYRVSGMLVADGAEWAAAEAWGRAHARRVERPPAEWAARCALDRGGIWLPEVAQVRNPRLGRALESALRELGVTVMPHTRVIGLDIVADRVVALRTDRQALGCEQAVVCAGAWSQSLLGEHALGARVFPVRGQILLLAGPPGLLPGVVYRQGRYLVPRADGRVLVGSTLEEAGYDKSVTEAARADLLRFALDTCPRLAVCSVEGQWAGLRPGSPGNLPAIGRHPRLANLYINSGHFRYGLTMAPAAAELTADLMLGKIPCLDAAPYAWTVSPRPSPGAELDEV
ncbi:MAG: glycine oxidase ThiO [Thiobacillaceae bacterium]|jgi:glycine oxidase|nr:glycine oxidase ThiO [Thiobacillaceae bacterium]